jgi:hypothetical protein
VSGRTSATRTSGSSSQPTPLPTRRRRSWRGQPGRACWLPTRTTRASWRAWVRSPAA